MTQGLRTALRIGIVGGAAAWHLSLVGMVEAFAGRQLLGEIFTLGYVLLLALFLFIGYAAARHGQRPADALINAVVAGGVVGLALGVLAWLTVTFDIRSVFANATPRLVELLTLERGVPGGLVVPVLGGLLFGALAGLLAIIPSRERSSIGIALLVTVLIALLRDVIAVLLPSNLSRFFFSGSGLRPIGALIVLIVSGVLFWGARLYRDSQAKAGATSTASTLPVAGRSVLLLVLFVFLLSFPIWAKVFLSNVADFVGLYVIMGLGLNLVVGFAGLLDLGYVAFYAIGAYTMAILTSPEIGFAQMTFWQALPFSMLAAMVGGILLGLPILRMRGDYLAIATLGFGEIIRILTLSDFLKPYMGGAQGITRIAQPVIGSFQINTPERFYYLILAGCLLAWFVGSRLKNSRLGRAWMAIREDEDVAQAVGINRVTAKLTAFAIGALLGGMSGGFFASMVGSVVPRSFELLVSINVLSVIIVGGMGSLPGVVVGALALVGLPELLREFREYRLLVYGAVLVVMMLYRPEGLWPEATRQRELHEGEGEAVAEEIPAVPVATPPREDGQQVYG